MFILGSLPKELPRTTYLEIVFTLLFRRDAAIRSVTYSSPSNSITGYFLIINTIQVVFNYVKV